MVNILSKLFKRGFVTSVKIYKNELLIQTLGVPSTVDKKLLVMHNFQMANKKARSVTALFEIHGQCNFLQLNSL